MRLWIAYVDDLYEPLDPARHCLIEEFAFTMSVAIGQIATVRIEREQSGWSLLAAGQPRNVLVSESPTGDPADAVVRARARITGLPSDLLGATQTIDGICAPADVQKLMLAYAKEHLADGPETDLRFSDADPDDVESYLLGRSGWLQVDPATHAISYVDDVEGEAVHDLAGVALWEDGRASDAPGLYDPPARTYRATLDVEWTMEASGRVDVASRLGGFTTLDPTFSGRIASALNGEGSEGWTAGAVAVRTRLSESLLCTVPGSLYDVYATHRQLTPVPRLNQGSGGAFPVGSVEIVPADLMDSDPDDATGGGLVVRKEPPVDTVSPQIRFRVHHCAVTQFQLTYAYSQPRSEKAYVALSMPAQDFVLSRDDDPETVELSLKDIFQENRYPEWKTDTDYVRGDRVRQDGRHYECVDDHHSVYFDDLRGEIYRVPVDLGTSLVKYFRTTATYWIEVFPEDLPTRASTYRYLDTPAGSGAVDHVLCRLRKTARRNLLARHVTGEFDWRDVAGVGIADAMSLVLDYDGRGTGRRVTARLVAMEYSWDENGAVVSLEGAIAFGNGGEAVPSPGDAWADGYADGYAGPRAPVLDEMYVEVDADPADLPVAPWRLNSPGYACIAAQVNAQADYQMGRIADVVDDGRSPTEVSVVHPTWAELRMRSLAAAGELRREIDVVALSLASPKGIDL